MSRTAAGSSRYRVTTEGGTGRRDLFPAASAFLAIALFAFAANAQTPTNTPGTANTCNGITFISYTDLPSFNTQGSQDSVIIQIGSAPTDGATTRPLSQIFFDLSCRHKGCSGNVNANCTIDSDCPPLQNCLTL